MASEDGDDGDGAGEEVFFGERLLPVIAAGASACVGRRVMAPPPCASESHALKANPPAPGGSLSSISTSPGTSRALGLSAAASSLGRLSEATIEAGTDAPEAEEPAPPEPERKPAPSAAEAAVGAGGVQRTGSSDSSQHNGAEPTADELRRLRLARFG
jgi:hypothetical protein